MSYSIQTKSKVLFLPKGTPDLNGNPRWEDDLFWFIKSGDNNVSPFSPRWNLQSYGWSYRVVGEVCRVAGVCEGGSVKFGTSPQSAKNISPEEYLADYRAHAARKCQLTVGSLQSIGFTGLALCNFKKIYFDSPERINEVVSGTYQREKIKEALLILKSDYTCEESFSCYSAPDDYTFRRPVEKVEDFLRWIELKEALKPLNVWG